MLFAVIDCGTTTTRIYLVDADSKQIVASGRRKVGVRDTSITGSRDSLRTGVSELFFEIIENNRIPDNEVSFAIASGMITSEVGLVEVPHLTAPAGLEQLSDGVFEINDNDILPIGRPICFIRGIKNRVSDSNLLGIDNMDFMRGEEAQCIGIMQEYDVSYPSNFVALSSHTKVMYIGPEKKIEASCTTLSGQVREAIISATSIGKSLGPLPDDISDGYTFEDIINTALNSVNSFGLLRSCMMPRFMHVLMRSEVNERQLFLDAAIAADDMKAFKGMRDAGYRSDFYLLYGHENRCRIYEYFLKKTFGDGLIVKKVFKPTDLDRMTVDGAVAIAAHIIHQSKETEE